jgi:hypothetical protein
MMSALCCPVVLQVRPALEEMLLSSQTSAEEHTQRDFSSGSKERSSNDHGTTADARVKSRGNREHREPARGFGGATTRDNKPHHRAPRQSHAASTPGTGVESVHSAVSSALRDKLSHNNLHSAEGIAAALSRTSSERPAKTGSRETQFQR